MYQCIFPMKDTMTAIAIIFSSFPVTFITILRLLSLFKQTRKRLERTVHCFSEKKRTLSNSGFSRPDATLREKPLRATVYFSIEHARPRDAYVKTSNAITSSCFAGNIRDLNIQRQDGNENVNKTIGLISKTTTLHVHHAFLPFSQDYDYDMKIPNFAFYGERKQATTKFHFSS